MSVAPGVLVAVPDLVDYVVGFRQWRLDRDGLRSLHRPDRWTEATLTAHCPLGRHPGAAAPAHACCCGIHAWYERTPRLASAGTPDLVCGAVVLWGAIELHTTGMRAQFARIVALSLPLSRGTKRRALVSAAHRLEVPAVRYAAVARLAEREGAPVPDSLKPGWAARAAA
jgi:hypothetical protein